MDRFQQMRALGYIHGLVTGPRCAPDGDTAQAYNLGFDDGESARLARDGKPAPVAESTEVALTLRVAYADPEAAKVAIEHWLRGDGPRPRIQDFAFEGESE